MVNLLLIFFGSGLGGVCRYLISQTVYSYLGSGTFPYGTIVVNTCGSFLIGILSVILFARFYLIAQPLRALLIIGFLGGFTTFSAFSLETLNLFENREFILACLNIVISVLLSLAMTWLGIMLGRTI